MAATHFACGKWGSRDFQNGKPTTTESRLQVCWELEVVPPGGQSVWDASSIVRGLTKPDAKWLYRKE